MKNKNSAILEDCFLYNTEEDELEVIQLLNVTERKKNQENVYKNPFSLYNQDSDQYKTF